MIKKALFVFSIVILLNSALFASKGFYVHFGPSYENITFTYNSSPSNSIKYAAEYAFGAGAVTFGYMFNWFSFDVSLSLDTIYTSMTLSSGTNLSNYTYTGDERLHYGGISIDLNFYPLEFFITDGSSKIKPYLGIGYELLAFIDNNNGGNGLFGYSITLGAGIKWFFGKNAEDFYIGLGFKYRLLTLNNNYSSGSRSDIPSGESITDTTSYSFSLYAGYLF